MTTDVIAWNAVRVTRAGLQAPSSNADSYVDLAESIQAWPDQQGVTTEIGSSGWWLEWHNLSGGFVALHRGIRSA
jgi:demethylmenaquinone methyltransferase/2-methoxy-6-polyprenyl-1,4-benzoquinol methylase